MCARASRMRQSRFAPKRCIAWGHERATACHENFPGKAVAALRLAGHDVLWIRESNRGISDIQVLAIATAQARLLLTFDKDFGELAFHSKLPAGSGIVLFRIRKQSPEYIANAAVQVLASRSD